MSGLETGAATANDSPGEHDDQDNGNARQLPILLFGIVSLGFLVFIAFGSVEARIWRFGRLYFEDRQVRDVWAYFGDHLPSMPGQPVITALYWISLAVMIVGVIAGLWLFLGTDDDEPSQENQLPPTDATSPHG